MPNPRGVDHRGRTLGPFIVTGPDKQKKRHWFMKCAAGHLTSRRIDILLRTKEESLHCTLCSKPLDAAEITEAFRIFVETLAPVQRAALGRLFTFVEELAR